MPTTPRSQNRFRSRSAVPALQVLALMLLGACSVGTTGAHGDSRGAGGTSGPAPSASAAPTQSHASASSPGPIPAPSVTPTHLAPPATSAPATAPASSPRNVQVVVTYHGWDQASRRVIVGAYVKDVVEEGGTCTLTLKGPGGPVDSSVTASPDAGTTACGELAVVPPASGRWSATVTYTSRASAGASQAVEVTVP